MRSSQNPIPSLCLDCRMRSTCDPPLGGDCESRIIEADVGYGSLANKSDLVCFCGISKFNYSDHYRVPDLDPNPHGLKNWKPRHFDKHRFDNYTDWLDRETRKRNRAQGQHIGCLGDALFCWILFGLLGRAIPRVPASPTNPSKWKSRRLLDSKIPR